ncbi:MAG: DUF1385 domain-containing protein [Ruminococcaceae bacterium]|nr:DUF1385 domain-containing protein [Oscillospiraceae bacterium]
MEETMSKANSKNEINNQCQNNNCRLGGVGGQAVLEGVMMKSKENYAIAVRKENGEIVTKKGKSKSIKDKYKFFGIPVVRGVVNLIESLMFSFKTLTDSAEMAEIELEEEPTKFEIWLEKKFGKSIVNVVTAIAGVLGVVLALFLFLYLPAWLAGGVEFLVENVSWSGGRHAGSLPAWGFNIIEGVFKIIIFILYIYLTSKLNDIKRVYQYHGAEHKTIFCYEKGLDLTVDNVKEQKRFHPRCGTSFIFVILIISIAVMTVATTVINAYSDFDLSNKLFRTVIKLSLLPLTVGIGYEFIRYAGKHNNVLTRVLSAPGLWMQRLTTREPDEKMIEVAITSLKAALPEEFPEEVSEEVNEDEESEDKLEKSEETTEQTGE